MTYLTGGRLSLALESTQPRVRTGQNMNDPNVANVFENSRFLQSSSTGNWANRLNWRHEVLLQRNRALFENRSVLDIAAHDGRFSWAALRLGARHVTGIEGRPELVRTAIDNLTAENIPASGFAFESADIFDKLAEFAVGQFDVVFCFGFFYHTIRHVEMVQELARMRPGAVILDTNVYVDPVDDSRPMVVLRDENSQEQHATVDPINLVGWTNRNYTEALFKAHGFAIREIDWQRAGIADWSDLADYQAGWRTSFIATR